MKSLIIRKEPLDLILKGKKIWEIRGSRVKFRGKIGLIQSGSGKVVGTAELVDCVGPLSRKEFEKNHKRMGIPRSWCTGGSGYRKTFAWVLRKAKRLKSPRSYKHPQGAIIWVDA